MKIELIFRSSREVTLDDYVYNLFIIYDEDGIRLYNYYCSDKIQTALMLLETGEYGGNPEEMYKQVTDDKFYDTKLEFDTLEELRDYFAEELI